MKCIAIEEPSTIEIGKPYFKSLFLMTVNRLEKRRKTFPGYRSSMHPPLATVWFLNRSITLYSFSHNINRML